METKNINLGYFTLAIMSLILISGCAHKSQTITDLPTKPKKPAMKKNTAPQAVADELQEKSAFAKASSDALPKAKRKKSFKDKTYEDFQESKTRLLKEGKTETAIKHIEKMIPLCNNIQELRDLTIELGDLFFEAGNLRRAEETYSQFTQLYPGDQNIEYVSYKAILCNYWMTLETQRDQTLTKTTADLSKKFLSRSGIFNQYTDEVEKILVDCQSKILESEINIFRFYLNHGDELSARTRLANIQKEFLEDMPHIEPQLIMLACEMAQTFNREEILQQKQAELAAKFPNYQEQLEPTQDQPVVLASNNTQQAPSFVDKF